jgi:DNA gyrase subunit A
MGRQATGVRGMRLGEGQRVVCMLAAKDQSKGVLTATENGFGKRTPIGEYPRHGRGGQGVIAIQTSERNGTLVGAVLAEDSDEVMLISTGGVLIRTAVAQIREQGRSTQGVTLIALSEGEKLAGLERIEERELEAGGDNGGNAGDNGGNAGNGNGGNGNGDAGHGDDAAEPGPDIEPPPPTVH